MQLPPTIHAGVVIVDGLDCTTEVELYILLNQPRVKWTKVAVLIIDTEIKAHFAFTKVTAKN